MDDFLFYTEYGIKHVLDKNGYDHVLFLIALTLPYLFKDWKKVLLLVSTFTIGHTFSLILAAYNFVSLDAKIVEFLIPLSILIVALYNIYKSNMTSPKINLLFISTLAFGLIHGLGFAREFTLLIGKEEDKLLPLLEFALGIEIAQIIVVIVALAISYLFQKIIKVPKHIWLILISALVVLLVLPMLINSDLLA